MGVAFVAAYMLVLQGLLGAFTLGAAAASPGLDAFGNPLCITSGSSAPAFDGTGHDGPASSCAIACGMVAPVAADGRAPNSLSNPLVPLAASAPAPDCPVGSTFALQRGPGSPRSPPATA